MQTVLARAWTALVDAAAEPGPFSLGYFGTVGLDGAPQVRAVIIRGADVEAGSVVFATNASSAKVAQLEREPRAALTFFDSEAQVQLRMTGEATVTTDDHPENPYAIVDLSVANVDVLDMSGEERQRYGFTRDGANWDGTALPA